MASSADHSHIDSKDGAAPGTVPYGTRSRNRPGASRPNYAEDKVVDFEMHAHHGAERELSSSRSTPATVSRHSPTPSLRRNAALANDWQPLNGSTIPGTSTFSANPNFTVAHSKKRKATMPQNLSTHSGQFSAQSTYSGTRRGQGVMVSRDLHRDNNMYSFEKTEAKLKYGKLQADDGTVFAVNGEHPAFCSFCSFLFPVVAGIDARVLRPG